MFPSVIVGDIAGIVKFCAASTLEQLRKSTKKNKQEQFLDAG